MPNLPATKEDIALLRNDLRDHILSDEKFQNNMFDFLGKRFDRLDVLWDESNKRKGKEEGIEQAEEISDKRLTKKGGLIAFLVTTGLNILIILASSGWKKI